MNFISTSQRFENNLVCFNHTKTFFGLGVVLFILGLFFNVSCDSATQSSRLKSQFSFVDGDLIDSVEAEDQLKSSADISHRVIKETRRMPSGGLVSTWSVQFDLSLNPSERGLQTRALSQRYGAGHMTLNVADTQAELRDFLRPSMQAILNTAFPNTERVERGLLGSSSLDRPSLIDNFVLRPTVRSLTNCWTTVYEVLRNEKSSFVSFFASDAATQKYIGGGKFQTSSETATEETDFSLFVKELTWQEACVPANGRFCPEGNLETQRNSQLKPGDYLLVYSAAGLVHAAVFLDSDFYFEKTGAKGDAFLYRLVPFSEISRMYKDPSLKFRYRRMKELAQLPHPLKAFDGRSNKIESAVTDLLPQSYFLNHRVAHQPEANDSRDISIYDFQTHVIEQTADGRFRLEQ